MRARTECYMLFAPAYLRLCGINSASRFGRMLRLLREPRVACWHACCCSSLPHLSLFSSAASTVSLQPKIGKGTPAMGRRHTKTHTSCRRCGRVTFHMQRQECASCGYPSSRMRRCEFRLTAPEVPWWGTPARRGVEGRQHAWPAQLRVLEAVFVLLADVAATPIYPWRAWHYERASSSSSGNGVGLGACLVFYVLAAGVVPKIDCCVCRSARTGMMTVLGDKFFFPQLTDYDGSRIYRGSALKPALTGRLTSTSVAASQRR